jgi:DNA-binding MarR family transcriptional regulator
VLTAARPIARPICRLVLISPDATPASACATLGYDRSQLVGWLDELEERGLIERRRVANDRRRHLVSLTPQGKRALRRLRAIVKGVDDEFFAPLDAEQRATLQELLLPLAPHHDPRYTAPPRASS